MKIKNHDMKIKIQIIVLCGLFSPLCMVAQSEKAKEILEKANVAVSSITSIQYDYAYEGWGKSIGKFIGSVKITKQNGMHVLVDLKTLTDEDEIVREEIIYTDGNNLKLFDKMENVVKVGTASGGSGYLMSYAWYAVFRESLMPNPFAMALVDSTLSYEGTREVRGVSCHVIATNNPWGDRNYWYLGQKDYQIYGQRQENNGKSTEGGFTFEMFNVQFDEILSPSVFHDFPNDVRQIDEDKRLVAVGEQAPDWLLENASGQKITARQQQGKKVILDFWASWCSPCWKIMPVLNNLKSEYSTENVEVYGVNVWENPKLDVEDYIRRKKLDHYNILIDNDASVAKSFKIAALPLIVVIDEAGKIIYLNNGQDKDLYENIKRLLN